MLPLVAFITFALIVLAFTLVVALYQASIHGMVASGFINLTVVTGPFEVTFALATFALAVARALLRFACFFKKFSFYMFSFQNCSSLCLPALMQ